MVGWNLYEKNGQTNICLSLITTFGRHPTRASCSTSERSFCFFLQDIYSNDAEQWEGLRGRKDVLYYLTCHWREFTSQVGREIRSGWVCGWEGCDLSMEGNSVLCCSGKDWYWDTGRKRRCHGTPSRNRRRNVASESRFGNTVKRGLWELEVEVEQTTLKYCTRTQVTYTLQLNTVVTLPERLLHLVLYTHTSVSYGSDNCILEWIHS